MSHELPDIKNVEGVQFSISSPEDIRKHSEGSIQIDEQGNFLKYSKWAQITDLMRLEIIYNHGGYYFDTTFECVKPLFDLFNIPKKRFVGCNESTYNLKDIYFF